MYAIDVYTHAYVYTYVYNFFYIYIYMCVYRSSFALFHVSISETGLNKQRLHESVPT